jgi:AcrR family transcriptional regulator
MTRSLDTRVQTGSIYQAISEDFRYRHYVRIPGRVCRSLDYFNVTADHQLVEERLCSYYLFIGVADQVIDSLGLDAGREILIELSKTSSWNEETSSSPVEVVTEVLKSHIDLEMLPTVLTKLEELYEAVVRERESSTMAAYIEERRVVGGLTAEISYLLIRSLLKNESKELACFFHKIGEVGCLVDSVIDLRSDHQRRLLAFRPTPKDYLELISAMLHAGLPMVFKHPRLLGLFLAAVSDDLLDLFRGRETDLAPLRLSHDTAATLRSPDSLREFRPTSAM